MDAGWLEAGGRAIAHALRTAGPMTWQVTWSLVFGFALSAVIEAMVPKATIARLLPDDRPRSLATATVPGASSSSCSQAAVALARSLVRKGADFTSVMAFQFASTNLVIELGLILAMLLGWQFTLAEFIGGPLMIVLLALMFRRFVSAKLIEAARVQADRGVARSMEGHAAMDMSPGGSGTLVRRLLSPADITAVSHNFVTEWAAVIRDLVIGLLTAGMAAAWIPRDVLATPVRHRSSAAGHAVGTDCRPAGGDRRLRMLDRQCAARGRAVERRH